MIKAVFCWSGGKDSAYCLQKVLEEKKYEVCYLLTTINEPLKRVSIHGIREELIEAQADSIGIPLQKVYVNQGTNAEYESVMQNALLELKSEGIEHIIYGDIFLEDLRQYREESLSKIGVKAIFPLWKMDTKFIVQDFIEKGFKSIICCVNDGYLTESFVGRTIDESFINDLPENVDLCGENGEYHSFCFTAPFFKKQLEIEVKQTVYKSLTLKTDDSCTLPSNIQTLGFWYSELALKA